MVAVMLRNELFRIADIHGHYFDGFTFNVGLTGFNRFSQHIRTVPLIV
jgi:hypothetical protein